MNFLTMDTTVRFELIMLHQIWGGTCLRNGFGLSGLIYLVLQRVWKSPQQELDSSR
jgi:hypothetical protein